MKKKEAEISKWEVSRILIYTTNIQIGCYGMDAVEDALPTINEFVNTVNEIRESSGYSGKKCRLDKSGGNYLYIVDLEGFSLQAGWFFAGILYKDNWRFGEIHDNIELLANSNNANFRATTQLMRIDMHRFN